MQFTLFCEILAAAIKISLRNINTTRLFMHQGKGIRKREEFLEIIVLLYKFISHMGLGHSHTSEDYKIDFQMLSIIETNKRINTFYSLSEAGFSSASEIRRKKKRFRASLSLNYFGALVGTCVRYGVMDDAPRKPTPPRRLTPSRLARALRTLA